jgi:hypothetical protein
MSGLAPRQHALAAPAGKTFLPRAGCSDEQFPSRLGMDSANQQSFALLALGQFREDLLPPVAMRRRRLAEGMLYDRMCPGGGWNCGNPRVYGVPGEPLVVPTAWALLALRNHPERPENVLSLAWLENSIANIYGAGSLALARICLETYGRSWPASAPTLPDFHRKNEFLQNIQVVAWACLASSARRRWLTAAADGLS